MKMIVFSLGERFDSLSNSTVEHKRYGKGVLYTGKQDGGIPHGKRSMICQYGVLYAGEWKNGARYGKGKCRFPCSAICEGGF